MKKRLTKIVLGLAALAAFALGGAAIAAGGGDSAQPGTIDDGGALLPKAGIAVDEAIAAAKSSASGEIGEVDLEYEHSTLVYNVDVGRSDVKVDASDGSVVGAKQDDPATGAEESGAEGSEQGDADGPGGHADEPGNPNANHEFEGQE